jgi:prepilin-type N-terminal cleavage/methylation domain-containing protein
MEKSVPYSFRSGFTLIELSIVLVIIGLIVGGILTGSTLISQASLRQAVSFHEKVRTAVATFKTRYNGLPGDLSSAKAASFGLSNCSDITKCGNDNGVVAAPSLPSFYGEAILFWRHLAQAGLIASSVDPTAAINGVDGGPAAAPATPQELLRFVPLSPFGQAMFYLSNPFNVNGRAGISIAVIGYPVALVTNNAEAAVLTPLEAYAIDSKIDDGKVTTGLVWSYCNNAPLPTTLTFAGDQSPCAGMPSEQKCATFAGDYNTSGSGATLASCELTMVIPEINR